MCCARCATATKTIGCCCATRRSIGPTRRFLASLPSAGRRAQLAGWGAQIVRCLPRHCVRWNVPKAAWPELLRPFVKLDLSGATRLGFFPFHAFDALDAQDVPPEASVARSLIGEPALVFVIGTLLRGLVTNLEGTPQRAIVERCATKNPDHRYPTLEALQKAWLSSISDDVALDDDPSGIWSIIEDAVGLLALGRVADAGFRFRQAWERDRESKLALDGLELLGIPPRRPHFAFAVDPPPPPPPPPPPSHWSHGPRSSSAASNSSASERSAKRSHSMSRRLSTA